MSTLSPLVSFLNKILRDGRHLKKLFNQFKLCFDTARINSSEFLFSILALSNRSTKKQTLVIPF